MLRLKEIRKNRGLSQEQLAQVLDVTQATLSGWETEKYDIDTKSLMKFADYFNISTDYLLGREGVAISTGDIANNNGIIGHNGTISTKEVESSDTLETDMLRIFRNANGKTKMQIMQFMYEIEEKSKQ